MRSVLMRAFDRIRRVGWLCLWLLAKQTTRTWMDREQLETIDR